MKYDDLPRVMKVEREVFSDPWSEAMFRQELEAESAYVMEVKDSDEIVGYACGLKIIDEYMLTNIAISKDYQHQGYGSKLLVCLLKEIMSEGCKRCFLEVRASNRGAIDFYYGFGFKLLGTRREYYRNPVEDALVMQLDLHSPEIFKEKNNG